MSLKEKFERNQSQWAAEAKRAQNQQVAEADFRQRCQRMYEELGLQTSDGISEKLYKDTLPIELPPEYQALIDEFIEICSSKAWEKSPDPQVDRAVAYCKWGEGWPDSRHLRASCGIKDSYISQVKLSDGSIHLYYSNLLSVNFDLGVESDLVKPSTFFYERKMEEVRLSGIEKVLQEMQTKLDCLRQHKYGTGEFIHLSYLHPNDSVRHIYLFRDKNLHDLKKDDHAYYAPYKQDKDKFERWLLDELKKFVSLA